MISPDVLARYAADAAREVDGVLGLVGRNDGVKVSREEGRVAAARYASATSALGP